MEEFAEGEFQEVIDDVIDPLKVKKVVLCTGKFYYDLLEERSKKGREDVALIRLEQIFPLHTEKLESIFSGYTNAENFIWAQEEPRNMGAWSYILQRFDVKPLQVRSLDYYAVPAAGSSARFKRRHQRVIDSVFDDSIQ
jgi:2-oxoglutarate dehydrogenase E1 component